MAAMAWHYKQYAKEQSPQDRENYEVAEFNTKIRRQGLWADTNPVPPKGMASSLTGSSIRGEISQISLPEAWNRIVANG
jgi:hypothetical protein